MSFKSADLLLISLVRAVLAPVKHQRWRVFAATFAAVIGWAGATGPTLACNPNRSDDGNGYQVYRTQTSSNTIHGVQSHMSTYNPYVPKGYYSYGWVMLTKGANWYWAQIGNKTVVEGRERSISYAYGVPNSWYWIDLPGEPLGTQHWETVTFTEPNAFGFETDGSSAYSDIHMSWTPTAAIISSEISGLPAQMMGDSSTNQWYWSNEIELSGGWVTYSGVLPTYNTTHFGASGSAQNFDTWDKCQ